jgi:starch phosphorylase
MDMSTPMMPRTTPATPRRSTRCWRTRWCRSSTDEQGIPTAWVARMRQSMAQLTPQYSAARTVREYTERHYLPAASAYRERAAGQGARAAELVGWRRELDAKWSALRIGEVRQFTQDGSYRFEAQLYLDGLAPDVLRVELYANGLDGGPPERVAMQRVRQLVGAASGYAYALQLPASRPASDYTLRVIPAHAVACVPLENEHILWQR